MTRLLPRLITAAAFLPCLALAEDLSDYRTVRTATTTTIRASSAAAVGAVGYLGVRVTMNAANEIAITGLADGSRAARAGLAIGDVIAGAEDQRFATVAEFRDWLRAHAPGEGVALTIRRKGVAATLTATLDSASHPLQPSEERGYVGISYAEPNDRGAVITNVTPKSPAAAAGVKAGDLLTKVGDSPMLSPSTLSDVLTEKKPGDELPLTFLRGEAERPVSLKLGAAANGPTSLATVLPSIWKRDTYRLAVIGVEFSDTKMNPKIPVEAWSEALFSLGTYHDKTSVTGQKVHGSFADFYREISCGKFTVSGKVFAPVAIAKKREEYATTSRDADQAAFYNQIVDQLLEREGKEALKDFDGLIFIYAGERYPRVNRGAMFWPHRASFARAGKRLSYYICAEGGATMMSISVFCHEFGHMLGLPDLYARPENPGSEGVGVWCLMSNNRGGGQPQHPSAWCKEQLGWLKPAIIDPTVPQKLVLAPVEGSTDECFKIPLRPDGAEYLLLENRRRTGFDASLPAEGLLIWRIVGRRPILEESHGVEGPVGPRVFLGSVPYPSPSNNAFTPFTTPSSRAQLGGGRSVHLTNIRQLADGRVSFEIGYEYQ
ncbi:MAG: M6 family metalloprotease domain-containing protein [Chthoniobacteraceae bacterium]